MKTYEYEQGSETLYLRLTLQRRKREPITETLLQERALILPSQEVSEREPDLTPNTGLTDRGGWWERGSWVWERGREEYFTDCGLLQISTSGEI